MAAHTERRLTNNVWPPLNSIDDCRIGINIRLIMLKLVIDSGRVGQVGILSSQGTDHCDWPQCLHAASWLRGPPLQAAVYPTISGNALWLYLGTLMNWIECGGLNSDRSMGVVLTAPGVFILSQYIYM